MGKRLFLIDGTALAYRSFFAFANNPRTNLTTSTGHPTSATYGFGQTLRSLLERENPEAIAISFDGPSADLYRTEVYPQYKSTREKMPDDMAVQLDDIRELVSAFGIEIVEATRDEADDVIGTLAVAGRDAGMEVFIVTGDKDFLQLVDDRIKLWNLRSSTTKPEILGPDEALAKWGVATTQMIDLLALMGDSSDNIPGVPRVGEKTAVALLQQFGTLDEVLARTAEVKKPSIRKSLEENTKLARLSQQLVTIRLDLELPVAVRDLGPARPDTAKLRALYERLQFSSSLAKLPTAPRRDDVERDYQVVRTAEQLETVLDGLRQGSGFGLDVEVSGAPIRQARVVGAAFSWAPGKACYVPFDLDPPILPGGRAALVEALRPLLEDPLLHKTSHNGKLALGAMRTEAVEVAGLNFDSMLASYCSQPGVGSHELDALTLRHLGFKKTSTKDLLGSGKKQKTFADLDVTAVSDYACEDVDYSLRLREILQQQLEKNQVQSLFHDLEVPLIPVLLDMEWEGIALDTTHLASVSRDMNKRAAVLEQRVHERAGADFNLASPQQVGKVLFEDLEVHRAASMPRPRRTATGQYRTDHDVLEKLARHHEVPQMLLEWRMLTKLQGTYVDSLPNMVRKATGRIHTTFNQAVAATGRLSSDKPNLQNIPIRSEEGRRVRAAFVPRDKGWLLLSADYSQIELRILAHFSNDRALVESFNRNEDIHARTAAIVHGLLPDLVTPELRNQAKVINYGLMYGMGASRLANETGMKPPEARRFIENYFRALPGVKQYLDGSLEQARERREVRTLFERRRPLPEIDSTNAGQRIAAENMAVNSPIQGTAADIVKRAMLGVHDELKRRGLKSRLILQVHDELVLDVSQDELTEVERLVKDAMVGAADLRVPLDVTIGSGPSWLAAH